MAFMPNYKEDLNYLLRSIDLVIAWTKPEEGETILQWLKQLMEYEKGKLKCEKYF